MHFDFNLVLRVSAPSKEEAEKIVRGMVCYQQLFYGNRLLALEFRTIVDPTKPSVPKPSGE